MDKTGITEWMLVRRFGSDRASEIAGDLLEQYAPARARFEMLRVALAVRPFELLTLSLISFLFLASQTALFSPFKIHSIGVLSAQYTGWSWDMFATLSSIAHLGLVVTATAILRAGWQSTLTRSALFLSFALSVIGVFMLQTQLRHMAPIVLALVILWMLRSYGAAATLSPIIAIAAFIGCFRILNPTIRLSEIRHCLATMHHPISLHRLCLNSGCLPLLLHQWAIYFAGSFLVFWLVTFLPNRPSRIRGIA